jgi:hypothetical protein
MTPRQILTIDLMEIKALEVTCSHCGAMFTIPLPKDVGVNLWPTGTCLACNASLWNGEADKTFQLIRGLKTLLVQWKNREKGTIALGFSLSTQEEPANPPSKS